MKNNKIKKIGKVLLDVLELHIPAVCFLTLFVCFILGIFFRYVLKDPKTWTFELSNICYVAVGVLSWGVAHRTDDNVVFDMLYNKLSPKVKCILRGITNLLITATSAILVVPSINYILSMEGLKAQTLPIPRGVIFLPFTISFAAATLRSLYRLILDLHALEKGTFEKNYGKKEEVNE